MMFSTILDRFLKVVKEALNTSTSNTKTKISQQDEQQGETGKQQDSNSSSR